MALGCSGAGRFIAGGFPSGMIGWAKRMSNCMPSWSKLGTIKLDGCPRMRKPHPTDWSRGRSRTGAHQRRRTGPGTRRGQTADASQVLNDALGVARPVRSHASAGTRLWHRTSCRMSPRLPFSSVAAAGNGVLVARDPTGHFSDPVFVNLTGGSFGFQWGVTSTDVILVFTTKRSIDRIASAS